MTCSSSPSPRPHVERGAGTAATQQEQKEEKGRQANSISYIFIQTYMEDSETYARVLVQLLPLGPPSTCMILPLPPSRCLSCSPIVGYFLFGAVGLYGEGGYSSQPQVPTVFIHIVNSTPSSPIKQASQAWL